MKHPHLPSSILPVQDQMQAADAFGLRNISHEFIEQSGGVLLDKVSFGGGKTQYDPFTTQLESSSSSTNQLLYKHAGEALTLLEKERDLSLWERILPYPWGFLKGLHKRNSSVQFASPTSFQEEWISFFGLLDEVENVLSTAEISALFVSSHTFTTSLVMRFLRKKCVGISVDPIAVSLHRRHVNGGLSPADLHDLWGTTSCFFHLKLSTGAKETLTLTEINSDIKQALQSPSNLVRYRIPTLEDGVIEIGL